jgi:hypothetical protein
MFGGPRELDPNNDSSILDILQGPPLVTQAALLHAIQQVDRINNEGPSVFETTDRFGKIARTTANPGGMSPGWEFSGVNPGEFPRSYELIDASGRVFITRTRLFFRTKRELHWPGTMQWTGLQDCGVAAKLECYPKQDPSVCCANIKAEFLRFQSKWNDSKLYKSLINDFPLIYKLRDIKRVVCYELGALGHSDKPNAMSLIQHFLAYTLANFINNLLMTLQGMEEPAIALFAEDRRYCDSCRDFLCNDIGKGYGDGTDTAINFQIVQDLKSFTPEYLNENTIFVTFTPTEYALVPMIDLTGPDGPAALFCNVIKEQGTDDPEPPGTGYGRPTVVDRSQELFTWKWNSEERGVGWHLRPEIMKSELREFLDEDELRDFNPTFYGASYGGDDLGLLG